LAAALPALKSLKTLALPHCKIGAAGIATLLQAVPACPQLVTLDITGVYLVLNHLNPHVAFD
jgi:hypothetical protein